LNNNIQCENFDCKSNELHIDDVYSHLIITLKLKSKKLSYFVKNKLPCHIFEYDWDTDFDNKIVKNITTVKKNNLSDSKIINLFSKEDNLINKNTKKYKIYYLSKNTEQINLSYENYVILDKYLKKDFYEINMLICKNNYISKYNQTCYFSEFGDHDYIENPKKIVIDGYLCFNDSPNNIIINLK